MLKIASILLALWLPIGLAAAAPAKLIPVDEAARDPQLAELIARLVKACDEKNFKPFEEALSPNAIASFGGDEGVQGFRDAYGVDDPNSPFFTNFKTALTVGGAFIGKTDFAAPYVYANWPEDKDSFGFTAAIGAKTNLYAQPKEDAKVVADVTHQILEVIETDPADSTTPDGWIRVKSGKKSGYVKAAETRSPLDYRAVFQKTENRWWLGAFVAGD